VKKLKLVESGLDAGKFRIVQFLVDLDAGRRHRVHEAVEDAAERGAAVAWACAGAALSSDTAQANSRMPIQLQPFLALCRRSKSCTPSFPLPRACVAVGTAEAVHVVVDWIPAVPLSWGLEGPLDR
jgi:hypothetical protein